MKNSIIWTGKWIWRGLLYKRGIYTHFVSSKSFPTESTSFLSLVTDQAYDGFHWAGSQWKGWRNRRKGKNQCL